ncbi:ferredoxin family protein [Candidatus Aerophobetes bacterium]|nr:ferredoxin family protein [Candidatus Aerophobetes bacterium]
MIEINEELCKGCGLCVAFCPKDVLKMSNKLTKKGIHPPEVINEKDCTLCGNCMLYCPDLAIVIGKEEKIV